MSNKSPKTTSLDFQVGEMVDKIMPLLYSYERRYETISAINKVLGDSITLQVLDDKKLLKAELVSAISKKYQNDKDKELTAGTSGLRAVQIPASVQEITICSDNDVAGVEAAKDLSARLVGEGKIVRIATPPAGFKDFNDLLRNGNHHAK